MARILLADDEAAIRLFVEEALRDAGHEVRSADCPAKALPIAEWEKFDLVVSDVNMPGMSGFAFRALFAKMPGGEKTPFLFMSAADAVAEIEIAKSLGGNDRLLLKPFSIADLLRHVDAVLGASHAERGPIGSIPHVLDRIRADSASGILTVVEGRTAKRFVFRRGALVFALSTEPKDLIGQAMVRAAVITESDLREALAASEPGKRGLSAALTAMEKLTPAQCEKAFVGKIREALLDVLIWERGEYEFLSGLIGKEDAPFPVAIDLVAVLAEGARRLVRWESIRDRLPAGSDTLRKAGLWPAGFPKNAGDQLLARHLERGLRFDDLLLELRGQRFAVGVKVVELLRAGALEAVPDAGFSGSAAPEPSPKEIERARVELEREATPAAGAFSFPAPSSAQPRGGDDSAKSLILAQGLVWMRDGEIARARDAFLDVLKLDPLHPLARRRLQEADAALAAGSRDRLDPKSLLSLGVPVSSLVGRKIDPEAAFVISRLVAGSMTVRDLLGVCPIPEAQVIAIVEGAISESIIRRT